MTEEKLSQILEKCTVTILKIPVAKTFAGRESLLNGIPSISLDRNEGNANVDIALLTRQLISLETDDGTNCLLILLDNAIWHVNGTTLALELQDLRQTLQRMVATQKTVTTFERQMSRSGNTGSQHSLVPLNHGALWIDDQTYIFRNSDELALQRAKEQGETLVILAPSKMGKTSLLNRYLAKCEEYGKVTCQINLSELSQYFDDFSALLKEFASLLLDELDLECEDKESITSPNKLRRFIEKEILNHINKPVVIAVDDADVIVGQTYQTAFFSMFRTWHNRRAKHSLWRNLDIALVISVRPAFLIEDSYLSPFNVTIPIELGPFTLEQAKRLNQVYGKPFDTEQVSNLWKLVNGHPYLLQLLFLHLSIPNNVFCDYYSLMQNLDNKNNIFSDHLNSLRVRIKLKTKYNLPKAIHQIIQEQLCSDINAVSHLLAMGLIRWDEDVLVPANEIYKHFLLGFHE